MSSFSSSALVYYYAIESRIPERAAYSSVSTVYIQAVKFKETRRANRPTTRQADFFSSRLSRFRALTKRTRARAITNDENDISVIPLRRKKSLVANSSSFSYNYSKVKDGRTRLRNCERVWLHRHTHVVNIRLRVLYRAEIITSGGEPGIFSFSSSLKRVRPSRSRHQRRELALFQRAQTIVQI